MCRGRRLMISHDGRNHGRPLLAGAGSPWSASPQGVALPVGAYQRSLKDDGKRLLATSACVPDGRRPVAGTPG
jgi:hypothetical protein